LRRPWNKAKLLRDAKSAANSALTSLSSKRDRTEHKAWTTMVSDTGKAQATIDNKSRRKLGATAASQNFSFYDNLRASSTASFRPVQESPPNVGRALHIASDPDLLPNGDVTLCHVPIFLPYSIYDLQQEEILDVSSLSYGGTAAALLAMHHFNNGDGVIVEELAGINQWCNVRAIRLVFLCLMFRPVCYLRTNGQDLSRASLTTFHLLSPPFFVFRYDSLLKLSTHRPLPL